MTNINEVTEIKGNVVPRGLTQVVQHLDGGIITDILVDEGDEVFSGQTLLKINDGGAIEDLAELEAKQNALIMKSERLKAFVNDTEPKIPENILESLNDLEKEKYIQYQNGIFQSMLKKKEVEKRVLDKQIKQNTNEVAVLMAQRGNAIEAKKYAKEALLMHKELEPSGNVSKLDLIEYNKKVAEHEGEIREIDKRVIKTRSVIDEFKQRLISLSANYKESAYQQIEDINIDMLRNKEVITKLKRRVSRLNVRSPVDGIVQGLKINTIGGVIGSGKVLMEILPSNTQLIIDGKISPRDIGHVRVGQAVQVKISSYDFSRYGIVAGTLEFISATTFLDDDSQSYYRARVVLSKQYVGNDSERNRVLPGMTVDGGIVTGEKTILAYMLKPIHLSLKNALTER